MNKELFYKWYEAKQSLEIIKKEEMELRRELATAITGEVNVPTKGEEVVDDYEIKVNWPQKLVLDDQLLYGQYISDEIPVDEMAYVNVKATITASSIAKISDDSPIHDCYYFELGKTPTITVKGD